MTPEVVKKLATVRLLILDVDGVLTDGRIHLDGQGETKTFDVQDGLGLALLKRSGVQIAIITGRQSEAVAQRAKELGIDWVFQGARDKRQAYATLLAQCALSDDQVCCVGDDLPDLPLILRAGVGVAVANACDELKARAAWTTRRSGGRGAVREVCEAILKAQGAWDALVESYQE